MLYSTENKNRYESDISSVCGDFHDSICKSFNYNRITQEVEISMDNYYDKTRYYWKFNGVKMFFSTNFDFWGYPGKRLHEFDSIDFEKILPSLNHLKTFAYEDSKKFLVDRSKNLLGLHFLFVSGNEIFILCESINVSPDLQAM